MQKVGVLGSASVGQTLARGFKSHGYDVRIGSRTPAKLADFTASSGIPGGTFVEARLVKAFNSIGSARMVNPTYAGGRPTMCYCGNDAAAKTLVAKILEEFGWEAADMGSAVAARAIEPLCQLWCIPGFRQNHWTHAFRILWS